MRQGRSREAGGLIGKPGFERMLCSESDTALWAGSWQKKGADADESDWLNAQMKRDGRRVRGRSAVREALVGNMSQASRSAAALAL